MTADSRHTPAYWDRRASAVLGTRREASAVCDPSQVVGERTVPVEERGARRVAEHLPRGARTLEVGCGYGRWFELMGAGRRLIGMDFSMVMGRSAATRQSRVPVLLGDARRLPVAAGSLDAAYTMKVLQFLPEEERAVAVAGIFRAVRAGGTVVLYEKTAGPDGSPPDRWIHWGERAGGRLVRLHGNQFAPLDRGLAFAVRALRPPSGPAALPPSAPAGPGLRDRHPRWFRLYDRLRRLVMRVSLRLEPVLERVLPGSWAEHGIFVFEKPAAG